MKKKFLIYLFMVISSSFLNEQSLAMDKNSLEDYCIAGVIKNKAKEKIIVSSSGLVKTCRFLAEYWIKNGEVAPSSVTPSYPQVSVEKMQKYFSGSW